MTMCVCSVLLKILKTQNPLKELQNVFLAQIKRLSLYLYMSEYKHIFFVSQN